MRCPLSGEVSPAIRDFVLRTRMPVCKMWGASSLDAPHLFFGQLPPLAKIPAMPHYYFASRNNKNQTEQRDTLS
jgi:hypothetical protein